MGLAGTETAVGALALYPLAIASISLTVTKSKIGRGLRKEIARLGEWPKGLITCPYCFSHWVALGFALADPGLRPAFFLWTFGLVTVSCGWMGLINWGVGGGHAPKEGE